MNKFIELFVNAIFISALINQANAQTAPVKGKGQAQSTYQTIERLETPNSGVTVTADKAVLLEGDPENLLVNPGFEHQTFGTGWTVNAGTATVDTTNFYDGKKSMSISLSAVNGDILTQCVTPTGQKGGTNLSQSLRVKTTLSNLQVCSVIGTSEQQCIGASNSDSWVEIVATSVATTGSPLCVKLKSTSSATGTVKVDSGYVGRNRNIGTASNARKVVQIEWSGSQSANHDTDTKVTFSGASLSKLENFTFSSGTLTATVAGDYLCRANVRQTYVNDASLMRQSITKFYKNGSLFAREGYIPGLAGNNINSGGTGGELPDTNPIYGITMAIGDTLEVYYYQSNGSGLNRSINTATIDCFYFPNSQQQSVSASAVKHPTVTRFTSGSGSYTMPSGVTHVLIKAVGGGGGGGGSGTSNTGGTGGAGGNTTFGTSLITCNGGAGGTGSGTSAGGVGGSATINAPAIIIASLNGGTGSGSFRIAESTVGGQGAPTPFGGAGFQTSVSAGSFSVGVSAVANTGSGGSGATPNGSQAGTGGGGAGAYCESLLNNDGSTYSYSVGAGGTAGTAGTAGQAGGAGGSGVIIITEYYGYNAPIIIGGVLSFDATNSYSVVNTTNTITANSYTATLNEETLFLNPGAVQTITLPAASFQKGKKYEIVMITGSNRSVIQPASGTICGQSSITLTGAKDSVIVQSDGTNWQGLKESCRKEYVAEVTVSGCTTTKTNGNWISSTSTSLAGQHCALNVVSGMWSANVVCTHTPFENNLARQCNLATPGGSVAPTTSQINTLCATSTAGYDLRCVGDR